jgi:signal transduction histidine kinase
MAVLAIDLAMLNHGVRPDREKLVSEAQDRAHDIAKSVHDLSHRLHPAKLRLIGLISALQDLQHELSQPGIAITFTHENVPPDLPPDLMLCLFRIAQEALNNAIKHSRAGHVSVRLTGGPEVLTMTVEDDGVGFDVKAGWRKGLGLISMGERVETVGARIDVRSTPGAGTVLEVKLPLQALHDLEADGSATV